ncbi:MAG TPA: hypothetical protein VIJ16_10795 [Gemmatimonadaceae bacterium]
MKRLGAIAALLVLAAGTAAAQGGLSAGRLGAGFGVSFPIGELSRSHASGFNLGGTAEYEAPGQAMGIRGDLFYEHFAAKSGATEVKSAQAAAVIVNAIYHVQGSSLHSYLIGGMGLYRVTANGNSPGFNGGVGISIPLTGMTAYFEAQLHKVLTENSSYLSLPITFGLSF